MQKDIVFRYDTGQTIKEVPSTKRAFNFLKITIGLIALMAGVYSLYAIIPSPSVTNLKNYLFTTTTINNGHATGTHTNVFQQVNQFSLSGQLSEVDRTCCGDVLNWKPLPEIGYSPTALVSWIQNTNANGTAVNVLEWTSRFNASSSLLFAEYSLFVPQSCSSVINVYSGTVTLRTIIAPIAYDTILSFHDQWISSESPVVVSFKSAESGCIRIISLALDILS